MAQPKEAAGRRSSEPSPRSEPRPRDEAHIFPIVVGVDYDDTGSLALQHAAMLAHETRGAQLHLCHAVQLGVGMRRQSEYLEQALGELLEIARLRLAPWAPSLESHAHAAFGKPASALIQLAADVRASLIVIGTHKRRGFDRLVQGSVAHELINQAPCPTLISVPQDFTGLTPLSHVSGEWPRVTEAMSAGEIYRISRPVHGDDRPGSVHRATTP